MSPTVGVEQAPQQAAMERFGSGGMALLPWTKQIFTVMWEQLRLLLQVIYCTFMSVFQLFRFEVHVRITDETGQHIQHMSTTANPAESFLFSSLFDGDNGVMTTCAAASWMDFVSRTTGKEEGIFLGFAGDWNVFVSSSDSSSSNEACHKKRMGKSKTQARDISETDIMSVSKTSEKTLGPLGLKFWASRSDSESSWASSDDSSPDVDKEESERLWEFFSSPADPYNPMSDTDEESSLPPSSEEDEDEQLWKSLCKKDDPFHPLNFQACLQSSTATALQSEEDPDAREVHHIKNSPTKSKKCKKDSKTLRRSSSKPSPPARLLKHPPHQDRTLVPWKRPGQTHQSPPEERKESNASTKKVRFSPLVQVHVVRTWLFARQASRKGPWEEMARDRDRFQRRIQETDRDISHCLTLPHREKMRAYLDGALK
ncbi:unnamed protein product [Pleuronectes platessa]|uniref:Protein phosphatase 1 regulatory subunit 15A/B C-terminal domain-containing protein n=1 Tax=Pleuronectes platessa TaxID=8262 RepID=A0A9N7YWY1_PLEPL|nr:unnamed protein product [Pleuronectes platessa]